MPNPRCTALIFSLCVPGVLPAQGPLGEAKDLLQQVETLLQSEGGKRADARPLLKKAAQRLDKVADADEREDVARERWKVGEWALDVLATTQHMEDAVLAAEAWRKVCAFTDKNADRTRGWQPKARKRLAGALHYQAYFHQRSGQQQAAREAVRRALDTIDHIPSVVDDEEERKRREELGTLAWSVGDFDSYHRICEAVCAHYAKHAPRDPAVHRRARRDLANALGMLDRFAECLKIQQPLVRELTAEKGPRHTETLSARLDVGITLDRMRDVLGAAAEMREVVRLLEARDDRLVSPEVLGVLQHARSNLSSTIARITLFDEALQHREAVVRDYIAAGRAPNTRELLMARQDVAWSLLDLGRIEAAVRVVRDVYRIRKDNLEHDDPDLNATRGALGEMLRKSGKIEEAKSILETALESELRVDAGASPRSLYRELAWCHVSLGDLDTAEQMFAKNVADAEAELPGSAQEFMALSSNYASFLRSRGDFERAEELHRRSISEYLAHHPGDDARHVNAFRTASSGLALTLQGLGDLPGAIRVLEDLLDARIERLDAKNDGVQALRLNLARIKSDSGDFAGARPMYEGAAQVYAETRPVNDVTRQSARLSVGFIRAMLGDRPGATECYREVVAALDGEVPETHPTLLTARHNLAVSLREMGDNEQAETILRGVIAIREKASPVSGLGLSRCTLGELVWDKGALVEARKLFEAADTILQDEQKYTLHGNLARRHLLGLLPSMDGTGARIRELIQETLANLRERQARLLGLSLRARSEAIGLLRRDLDRILSVAEHARPRIPADSLFEHVETLRAVSRATPSTRSVRGSTALKPLRDRLFRAREAMHALATQLETADATAAQALHDRFVRASRASEQAETALRAAMRQEGFHPARINANDVAQALPKGSVAIGYTVYARTPIGARSPKENESVEHLRAHILHRTGTVDVVELGAVASLEALVERWRAALGQPLRGREAPRKTDELGAIGRALAARVLDKILDKCGGAKTLYVCVDGALHLVPLDALPLASGKALGDSHALVQLPSFAYLTAPVRRRPARDTLLAIGGVKFDAELPRTTGPSLGASAATGQWFPPLSGTGDEVADLRAAFEGRNRGSATLLTGAEATKAALRTHAPKATILHIATHGYFAPASVRSMADAPLDGGSFARTVVGLAPMTLCGLALAGANKGRDRLGQVPGILTAEELSAIDLDRCELAVLSACETNVGIRRDGHNIESLQAALHVAGAKMAITSLWRVDDAQTRRLMGSFYGRLFGGATASEALWQAKQDLRRAGRPLRDWAGWVLTGRSDRRLR